MDTNAKIANIGINLIGFIISGLGMEYSVISRSSILTFVNQFGNFIYKWRIYVYKCNYYYNMQL